MQPIKKSRWTALFLFTPLACLSACGSSGSFVVPTYNIGVQGSLSQAPFQVFLEGGVEPLEKLDGLAEGDEVHLEARGVPTGAVVAWFSSDVSRGYFPQPGVLLLRNAGAFEIRVHAAGQRLFIPVTATRISEGTAENNAPGNSDPFVDEVLEFLPGPGSGFGIEDFPEVVLGPPLGGGLFQAGTDVLSLGAGGEILLKSEMKILNGMGPDFIIFENPFLINGDPDSPFAEPARVSVSQDGRTFFTYPCEAENRLEGYPACAGVEPVLAHADDNDLDPTDPETAGGDGFDLDDLNLDWIQYIRIRDMSTSGSGNSAGFDLDAVAIIYQ